MKPDLNEKERILLKIRNKINRKRPDFKRQEWFRYTKLGESWRKPKGKHSKLREQKGYRPPNVDSGFRGPRKVRYLHPSGFRDILVYNTESLKNLDPKKDAVRIARTVGMRKKIEIETEANKLGLKVLNGLER
jgi:large subunit ribosomal protein L32e